MASTRESDPELCLRASFVSLKGAWSGLGSDRHIWVNRHMSFGSTCSGTHYVTLKSRADATLMGESIRINRGLFPAVRSRFRSPMLVFLCVCWWSFLLWRQLHPPADRRGICADVAPRALSNLRPGGAAVFGCGEQRLPAAGAHLRPHAGKTPNQMNFTG